MHWTTQGACAQYSRRGLNLEETAMSPSPESAVLDDFGGLIAWDPLNAWLAAQDLPGSVRSPAPKSSRGACRTTSF